MLALCVLAVVADETDGYEIAQRLHEAGMGTVKGGTPYPVLTRLEQDGLLVSTWRAGDGGPGRKFFAASPAGHVALQQRTTSWLTFIEQATRLLTSGNVTT